MINALLPGGMFIHWQANVVDKGCQNMAKSILWNRNPLMNELLLKMCHSKINKTLTGQRWMVLYSTNPWWTHTSWNFTHFGWYLKTGPMSSSKILQKGNNWHKIWKSYWYNSTKNMLAAQTWVKSSSWKWPGKRFHDDVQLHIDCK